MKYTDKQYYIEKFFIEKLDWIIQRAALERKLDAILLCDGDEGFGKTGISMELLYYLSQKTGRPFSLNNIFFDPKEFVKFVNSTKKQLILWDEAAMGALASGWQAKIQQYIIQSLMTCRYRQHVIIFNCPKFYRLNSYFVMDRAIGLIHVYSRDNITAGRVAYYKKDLLEPMYLLWSSKKRKPYRLFPCNHGSFPDAFKYGIIDEEEYTKKKDLYTSKILSQYEPRSAPEHSEKLLKYQYNIYAWKVYDQDGKLITYTDKAKHFGISRPALYEWRFIPKKFPEIFAKKKDEETCQSQI